MRRAVLLLLLTAALLPAPTFAADSFDLVVRGGVCGPGARPDAR